jgi:hypothetical protein
LQTASEIIELPVKSFDHEFIRMRAIHANPAMKLRINIDVLRSDGNFSSKDALKSRVSRRAEIACSTPRKVESFMLVLYSLVFLE